MNRGNIRYFVSCLLFALAIISVCSCSHSGAGKLYDKDWIIGKTSSEVEERYGKSDICLDKTKTGDNYVETGCGYLTGQKLKGLFGTSTDEFLMIFFDADGVAYGIEEDYPRPGG